MWNSWFGSSEESKPYASEVTFKLNGQEVTVGSETNSSTQLIDYIRDVAHMSGTKSTCHAGFCGSCVVTATIEHPVTKQKETVSVQSCLMPVFGCHGWDITTIEGLGDKRQGYHKIQATLAQFNGTQCGFCSPGMVMNMYSLTANKQLTMAEVENSFGGHICRCTGYRPILDAFKSLSVDAPHSLRKNCADIEDLYKICSKTGKSCTGSCSKASEGPVHVQAPSASWYKVYTVAELFSVFDSIGNTPYSLVAGNTMTGLYRPSNPEGTVHIDIKDVLELRTNTMTPSFTVGGNVPLTEVMALFNNATTPGYTYLQQIAKHIDWVANVEVRNVGTIGGNICLKRLHPDFPSDIFTVLETVGVKVNVLSSPSTKTTMSLVEFLSIDLAKKVVLSFEFPSLNDSYKFRSFKIMPRAQSSPAFVNAGFLVKVNANWTVTEQPSIVYGGINPKFYHASNTELFLVNKNLLDNTTISGAIGALDQELVPDWVLPSASPEYRKMLAQSLFYKFLLGLDSSKVTPANVTGAENLVRPLSSGTQDYSTDENLWPLNQPIPKIEAIAQTSGEAEYVNDYPVTPEELHAAFVLTPVATGTLTSVDPAPALAKPGVVAFFEAKDIPGLNNFMIGSVEKEEIFCSGQIQYAGQAVGIVVAKSRYAAMSATQDVILEITPGEKPLITIDDVLKTTSGRIKKAGADKALKQDKKPIAQPRAAFTIKGRFDIGQQHHMHMETHTCMVVPREDGLDVFSSTQFMDHVQSAIALSLRIPAHTINVFVRRLGGGYGSKITRATQPAAACALAANKLGKPVRLVMPLASNLEMVGRRFDCRHDYEVVVDDAGKIESLNGTIYQNSGFSFNDSPLEVTLMFYPNCYTSDKFTVSGEELRTDIASNTSCRAPGTTEGIAFIEEVMEHIARVTKLDPTQVRLANMTTTDNPLPNLIEDLKQKADYDTRRQNVDAFNATNRWKKRGMALVPMQYRFQYAALYNSLVSIFHIDGSVAITHGGIEMGQGLNTKVAQVAAYTLGIPLDKIQVKPSCNITAPNGMTTGGSVGSESVSFATMIACQDLLKKLEPIRQSMGDPSWVELIAEAYLQSVDLCSHYMFAQGDVQNYDIWGVTIAEVEVDMLTGEKQVVRVDILEDVGQSLSPLVDVGQIEGAFVMGLGYWMSEELVYDPETGRLTTTAPATYFLPGPKDIPADFRVYFRRDAPNMQGVLKSKATGEPAFCMSIVTLFAVQDALFSARKDAGDSGDYFQMKTPATAEHIFVASLTDPSKFAL